MISLAVVIVLAVIALSYAGTTRKTYDVDHLISGITKQIAALDTAASYHAELSDTYSQKAETARNACVRASNVSRKLKGLVS